MKKYYEVVTFNGKTWENLSGITFTSRIKAEANMAEWQAAQKNEKFKVVLHRGK